jgi:menaquinone-dependent protoporphyrinogen oxidase
MVMVIENNRINDQSFAREVYHMNEQQPVSRRRFLKTAGIAVGASALACGGGVALGSISPGVSFFESELEGNSNMTSKILVAYASKRGSTGGVAEAIAANLSVNGTVVEVSLIENVKDVSSYDAVVVGSAIRKGQWLSEAVEFVETNRSALNQVPTAFFTVCMTLADNETEAGYDRVMGFIDPVLQIHQPDSIGLFAGKMDYSQLSFFERTIVKALKVPEGDFRNWDAINGWAESVQPILARA